MTTSAGGGDDVQGSTGRGAVGRAREDQAPAVGRPARAEVLRRPARDPARHAAVTLHDPDIPGPVEGTGQDSVTSMTCSPRRRPSSGSAAR